ncbi:protein of unknown function DUF224 cysteine-rich region domain protein [Desulfofarcimen acetoxidans DSM 771]|uniref:Uncharacterized protein n=1 Tax=Desulfofarcimen acetoxidans (strain ATCC 49208 / DSM 771 / KCTC 5769 / VKM B-1644 / 5575) TaxID=485916 RepID=C8VWY1_DESAS|nr:heterodisulfide reductase-related iron-sulfur binding cluster [Desulfofarcimen acetoxidans]ACV62557.1 protein of unknown function DUF224 cysteine-rich region domain protein [Desulfofarcimen acetoxidans DSM 771]
MSLLKIVIFAALVAFGLFNMVQGIKERMMATYLGKKDNRSDNAGERVRGLLVYVLGQKKIISEPEGGIMHLMIFFGANLFGLGILQFILAGLIPGFNIPYITDNPLFYLFVDVIGLIAIIGIWYSGWRRWVQKVERLEAEAFGTPAENLILGMIAGLFIMMGSVLAGNGFKYALTQDPMYSLAPITGFLGNLFSGMSAQALAAGVEVSFWVHVIFLSGFMVFFRYSPHVHPVFAPLNVYFRTLKPRGGMIEPIDFENEEIEQYGAAKLEHFTWKDIMEGFACAECGRCQANCPAYLSGKHLSPKHFIHKLRMHVEEKVQVLGPALKQAQLSNSPVAEMAISSESAEAVMEKTLVPDVFSEAEIWDCTNCASCMEQCPVMNEHVPKIIQIRQNLVMMDSEFPAEAQLAFTNMERNYNPWGVGWNNRGDWASELDVKVLADDSNVDIVYFAGCAAAFDDRSQKVATSFVKILKAANVNFAILASEERCCGDSARRLGNEYLAQSLINENVEALNGYGVKKIVTTCPHCLTVLKDEYPQFGGNYEVIHHTQLINQLIKEGKLRFKPASAGMKITYHDSCFLGRYQNEYEAPRQIIDKLPGINLTEMVRNKTKGFCCGAGGGRMWLEEHGTRINVMRTEQALETGSEVVATNCPFCLTMMEDGIKDKGAAEAIKAFDLAELVERNLQ